MVAFVLQVQFFGLRVVVEAVAIPAHVFAGRSDSKVSSLKRRPCVGNTLVHSTRRDEGLIAR